MTIPDHLWALTTYFNPAGWRRRRQNFDAFRRSLKVPLLVVEYSQHGNFELGPTDADLLVQLRGGNVMWQKERLINIGLKELPACAEYIALLDADIIFCSQDWQKRSVDQLKNVAAIQPFKNVIHLNKAATTEFLTTKDKTPEVKRNSVEIREYSIAYLQSTNQPISKGRHECQAGEHSAAPGVAWVVRRSLFKEAGIYDKAILGGGDRALLGGLLGDPHEYLGILPASLHAHLKTDYLEWTHDISMKTGKKVGHIDGDVIHLWHGSISNRRYTERYTILADHHFDPNTDLAQSSSGAWAWGSCKPLLHRAVNNYFLARQEDE
jgi:hypothetical protein